MDDIRQRLKEFKASMERPRANAVTRAKPETELQKSFDEYRMAQQEARERLLSELPSRAVSGAIPGAVGALAGYGAQIPGGFGDLANLYQSFKPESFGNLPAGVQALPTTDDIQGLLREYINDSPEFSAGMTGGNAFALGQGAAALPAMAKGVAKGAPKLLGTLIDEILAPRVGRSGQRGAVGVRGKALPGELAQKLAQERAALPVDQGGLGLLKNNTSEQRAVAMGFAGEGYHGSLSDIAKFNPNKASTEGFAARGTYITDSPKDASLNYADIYGPDVKSKVERSMESVADDRNSIARIGRRFQDESLSPRQQEILLANTINADNLGVVYPLRYRSDKPVHLDRPQEKEVNLGPFERYDEVNDVYVDTPHTYTFEQALNEFSLSGGETNPIREFASEYGGEIPADALYRAVQKEAAKGFLQDDDGKLISSGVAAGDFLKHFGVDQIAHTPDFRNQQLNIGSEHTIAMNPDNIRSRFAAFDPFRKSAAIAAAMGVAAPDLMAKEKKRGGAVSQDVMNMAVMNQKVQKRGVGGVMKGVKAVMNAAEEAKRLGAAAASTSDRALPLFLGRSTPKTQSEIDAFATRVARQMLGEHVRSGKPKDTQNLAGRSLKESERVKALDYVVEPTGAARESVIYQPRKGDVNIAFPGDQTISDSILRSVGDIEGIDSLQQGGAKYGLGKMDLADPLFWAAGELSAQAAQNKINRIADFYNPERVVGQHLAMGSMSNNYAMHLADANLRAMDLSNMSQKQMNAFDNIIAYGYKHPATGEKIYFPEWPGIANPEDALQVMKYNPELRKHFNDRMKIPSITEPLGLPNGLDIQYAITEPQLRNMEINLTGLSSGEMVPGASLTDTAAHNTYKKGIRGIAKGHQEVLTPFELSFSDSAQHIASTQRPQDFTGTIQKVFPQQIVDDQYLDEIGRYRDLIKKYTDKKKGGVVQKKAGGGLTSDDLVLEERML